MGRRAQQSTGNSELPNTLIIWSGQSWEPPGALIANPGTLWVAENSSFPLCSRYSMAGNRTPIATRFEDRSNKMCKMTPSLFASHPKALSLLLQAVWFCLFAFQLGMWWFYVCTVTLPALGTPSFRWRCRWADFFFFFLLSSSHAPLKKKTHKSSELIKQLQRKPCIIKTSGNTSPTWAGSDSLSC